MLCFHKHLQCLTQGCDHLCCTSTYLFFPSDPPLHGAQINLRRKQVWLRVGAVFIEFFFYPHLLHIRISWTPLWLFLKVLKYYFPVKGKYTLKILVWPFTLDFFPRWWLIPKSLIKQETNKPKINTAVKYMCFYLCVCCYYCISHTIFL